MAGRALGSNSLHRIKVIPETNHNTLFVSFSDDSTTKVWDVNNMEGLHVINKPKLVYYQQGKKEREREGEERVRGRRGRESEREIEMYCTCTYMYPNITRR